MEERAPTQLLAACRGVPLAAALSRSPGGSVVPAAPARSPPAGGHGPRQGAGVELFTGPGALQSALIDAGVEGGKVWKAAPELRPYSKRHRSPREDMRQLWGGLASRDIRNLINSQFSVIFR